MSAIMAVSIVPAIPATEAKAAGAYDLETNGLGETRYWKEVWSDEFNGSTLDKTKWNYMVGTGAEYSDFGWGNGEQEYYTEGDNIEFTGEEMVITAKKSDDPSKYEGMPYTSTRIWTMYDGFDGTDGSQVDKQKLYGKKYGRIEARMKLPKGTGLWPAFWMMPVDDKYDGWAASGEIDIMEARGRETDAVDGTIHFGQQWPNNTSIGGNFNSKNEMIEYPEDFTIEDYHTYAVEWLPGQIRWYVDEQVYYERTNWYSNSNGSPVDNTFPAPFDQEFYIMFNLAVGGWYDGEKLDDTTWGDASMYVDYVRVYDMVDANGELTGYDETDVQPQGEMLSGQKHTPAMEADATKAPLNDGNQVYNGRFDQGEGRTYFWHANEGTMSVDPADADRTLEFTGDTEYASLTQTGIQIQKNSEYTLTFTSKSTGTITVNVIGEDNSTYYSEEVNLKANNELVFEMPEEYSDLNSTLQFVIGEQTVLLDNVKLVRNLVLPEDGNVIYNGDFNENLEGWDTYFADWNEYNDVGDLEYDSDSQQAVMVVKSTESHNWDNQLQQNHIAIGEAGNYILKFEAYATKERPIDMAFTNLGEASVTKFQLTKEKKEYTVILKGVPQTRNGSFTIMVGDVDNCFGSGFSIGKHSIYFDNVSLVKATDADINAVAPLVSSATVALDDSHAILGYSENTEWEAKTKEVYVNGIKISDAFVTLNTKENQIYIDNSVFTEKGKKYTVQIVASGYDPIETVIAIAGSDGNLIVDKFLSPWKDDNDQGNVTCDSSKITVNFVETVNSQWNNAEFWSLQALKEDITVKAGKPYVYSFYAQTTNEVTRDIIIEFGSDSTGEMTQKTITVTPEKTRYEIELVPKKTCNDYHIVYMLGGTEYDIASHVLTMTDMRFVEDVERSELEKLATPEQPVAEQLDNDMIEVTWTAVEGAEKYYVYRSNISSSGYIRVDDGKVTGTSFVDTNFTDGATSNKYYYKIAAVPADLETYQVSALSKQSEVVRKETITADTVSKIVLNATTGEVKEGNTVTLIATVYPESATDKTVIWSTGDEKIATVKDGIVTAVSAGTVTITATAKADESVKATYKLVVTANPDKDQQQNTQKPSQNVTPSQPTQNNQNNQTIVVVTPAKVTGLKRSKGTTTSIKVAWDKAANATAYEVVLYKGSKQDKVVTTTATSYNFKKLKKTTAYKVKVRAINGKTYGAYSSVLVTATQPAKAKLKSAKKVSDTKVKLTWKKVTGANGYQIYMKTGKGKFKLVKTLAKKKAVSYTVTKLKKGKSYTFKIRAYKKNGKVKVPGSYSNTKKIKM